MTALRVYGRAECDGAGVPHRLEVVQAEVLGELIEERLRREWVNHEFMLRKVAGEAFEPDALPGDKTARLDQIEAAALDHEAHVRASEEGFVVRCQDCWHPMADGRWVDPAMAADLGYMETRHRGCRAILEGREPKGKLHTSIHYSRCDRHCDHGGLALVEDGRSSYMTHDSTSADHAAQMSDEPDTPLLAAMRIVEVRNLDGWEHNMLRDNVRVLCLRCWARHDRGE